MAQTTLISKRFLNQKIFKNLELKIKSNKKYRNIYLIQNNLEVPVRLIDVTSEPLNRSARGSFLKDLSGYDIVTRIYKGRARFYKNHSVDDKIYTVPVFIQTINDKPSIAIFDKVNGFLLHTECPFENCQWAYDIIIKNLRATRPFKLEKIQRIK